MANGPALFYDTLKAWFMTGTACRVNFQLGEIDIWTKDTVLSHWYHMSADDILEDIYDCSEKVIMKRTPTARGLYIHKMGKSLHEVLKHMREGGNTCIHFANDERLMPVASFEGLANVVCRTFNVISGELVEFSMHQWLSDGYFRT